MKDRDFCRRLRELRKGSGFTQGQLAERSGLYDYTLISHYEIGTRTPNIHNLKALCKGLGCTATDLLGV